MLDDTAALEEISAAQALKWERGLGGFNLRKSAKSAQSTFSLVSLGGTDYTQMCIAGKVVLVMTNPQPLEGEKSVR